jgi:hypothetical protein
MIGIRKYLADIEMTSLKRRIPIRHFSIFTGKPPDASNAGDRQQGQQKQENDYVESVDEHSVIRFLEEQKD